jgi:hypothetical protein
MFYSETKGRPLLELVRFPLGNIDCSARYALSKEAHLYMNAKNNKSHLPSRIYGLHASDDDLKPVNKDLAQSYTTLSVTMAAKQDVTCANRSRSTEVDCLERSSAVFALLHLLE